ncbi:hypothetical protein RCU53_13340 [Escherichia coli]|nr:hypothetical protein [Escherichia coli]
MKKVNIGNVPKMLVPLFESGTIVFCRDFPEWQRLHQKLGVDVQDSDANGASHTMSSENGVLHVIGVFNGKLSTIAHERGDVRKLSVGSGTCLVVEVPGENAECSLKITKPRQRELARLLHQQI